MRGQQKNSGSPKIGTDSANSATTRGATAKRRRQADSASKTGLDTVLQEVLTVVESGDGGGGQGGDKKNSDLPKSGPILPIAPQPEQLRANGDDRGIKGVKL